MHTPSLCVSNMWHATRCSKTLFVRLDVFASDALEDELKRGGSFKFEILIQRTFIHAGSSASCPVNARRCQKISNSAFSTWTSHRALMLIVQKGRGGARKAVFCALALGKQCVRRALLRPRPHACGCFFLQTSPFLCTLTFHLHTKSFVGH